MAAKPTLCHVSGLVIVGICDHHGRRNLSSERVVGALLGKRESSGVVSITNYCPVPHTEAEEQPAIDQQFARTIVDLHLRINAKEVIVGWYSSTAGISRSSRALHEAFCVLNPSPVHLTLDGAGESSKRMSAYWIPPDRISDHSEDRDPERFPLASVFEPVPVELHNFEPGRTGLELLASFSGDQDPNALLANSPHTLKRDLVTLKESLRRLIEMFDVSIEYVESVLKGDKKGDPEVCRALLDAVSVIPKLPSDSFARMFNGSIQDLLMVTYLANLVRAQLEVSNRPRP